MKTILKAYLAFRINSIRARQHDLAIAWAHTKRTETNPLALVEYRLAVYKRQNELEEQREHFQRRLNALKQPIFKTRKA